MARRRSEHRLMKAAQPRADQPPIAAAWLRHEDFDAVPMLDLEQSVRRVRRRASAMLALVEVALAVAFALDARAVIHDPALAIGPLAMLLCVAVLATPLMRSGLRHGG